MKKSYKIAGAAVGGAALAVLGIKFAHAVSAFDAVYSRVKNEGLTGEKALAVHFEAQRVFQEDWRHWPFD